MRLLISAVLLSLLSPLFPASALAAEPRWSPIGPPGPAVVQSLAIDPRRATIAFAGLRGGGIARSEDGGLTWRSVSQGLTDPDIVSVVVHPRLSLLVFAQGNSGKLMRSLDGGETWVAIEVTENGFSALAPAPTDPRLVYAATPEGVLVSRDVGSHWRRVSGGGLPPGYRATALAIDARDPRLIYAGIRDDRGFGLWISEDAGRTWQRRLRGVPDALVADPQRSGTVYLFKDGHVQRSRDRGTTWALRAARRLR
jgi:photosystem II stability/assembly factor-like uncharacterized protein